MKTDFSTLIFSDEYRATLNELDEWASRYVFHENSQPPCLRKQQWGGVVMFLDSIVDQQNYRYLQSWLSSLGGIRHRNSKALN